MERYKLPKYLLCSALLFLSASVSAQETKTWIGAVSNNWTEAANWQPMGQPQSLSQVVIKKPANGNLPILNANSSVQSLALELGARLTLNGYKLTVNGDFKVGTSGIVSDHLVMTNANDEIIINGNATFAARTKLDAGRIVLRGNLTQESINTALVPAATVFVFEGTTPQTVRFQRPGTNNQSFFNNVIVRNPAGVAFLSDVHVTGTLRLENGGRLLQPDSLGTYFHQQLPHTAGGEYLVRKSYVAGQIIMIADCELRHPENDLTILSRNGLTLNGHRLHIGGALTVKAYGDQKHLVMNSASDVLQIEGDAIFEGFSTLNAGTIFVRGNLIQKVSSGAVQPAGTVFVFDGARTQSVSFERPGLVNQSFLQDAVIENSTGVNFASDVYFTGRLKIDGGHVAQGSAQGTYFTTALPAITSGQYDIVNSYVAGAIVLDANRTLPNADNHLVVLPRKALTLNGHTLRVGGNFTVKVFEEYKHLFMTNARDTLIVNGNAEFQGQSELTAGAIIIHGDLAQKIGGKSLQPSGTHFFLNGSAPQTVSFEKPGIGNRSFLKDLTLRNPAGVIFASEVFITGRMKLEAGTRLEQDEAFGVNFTNHLPQIDRGSYEIRNTNIAGALVMQEDLQLQQPATNLTILPRQSLTLNGHALEIGGNFKAGVFSAEKHLIMNNAADRLIINGDAAFEGLNVLQAGVIVLRGNLTQAISAAAVQPEGTAFIFDGQETQIVSFERAGTGNRSYLRAVTINAHADVRAITDVFITGRINNYGKFEIIETRSLFLGDAAGINHQGGTLTGNGTVNTPKMFFTNDGNMRPGAPCGIMRIAGSYVQQPAGKLTIEISGVESGVKYSRLEVSNAATIDGALELLLTNGYKVSVGDSFRVLSYAAATGRFARVIATPPKNVEFEVRYKATGVDVIAVAAANHPPVAQSDSVRTRMNQALTINVLQNDVDANDDPLKITALELSQTIGKAEIIGDSSIAYTPKENFHGSDSFGYTVSDGRGGVSTAIVYVKIERLNRQPVAINAIPDVTIKENAGASVLFNKLHALFIDPDGDALALSSSATAGLAVWIAGDSLLGAPQPDFTGPVQVTVSARDDSNAAAKLVFQVNVEGRNKAPSTFSLLQPQDHAIINPLAPVIFRWQAAHDANGDSLVYSVRVFNAASDTTVKNIKATELRFEGKNFLRGGTAYQWLAYVSDAEFTVAGADTFHFTTVTVSAVDAKQGELPEIFTLEQNYPNPFNPSTTIGFSLPKATTVTLSIFNSNGQLVKQLVSGERAAGRHNITWNATDEHGQSVTSGVYLYVIKAGDFTMRRKLTLLK